MREKFSGPLEKFSKSTSGASAIHNTYTNSALHATSNLVDAAVIMGDNGGFLSTLETSIQSFIQPSPSLHSEALAYLKTILDPLARDVADAQKFRRDENRKKRKRTDYERGEDVLQLRQVYTNGLGVKQVWEQTRRILDATCAEIENDIAIRKARQQTNANSYSAPNIQNGGSDDALGEDTDVAADSVLEDVLSEHGISDEEDLDIDDVSQESEDLENVEDIEAEDVDVSEVDEENTSTYVQDPNKLNDGFFSIDDFNKQTQFLEQQDARGEDDNPSDEDDIDWDADPLTMSFHQPKAAAGRNGGEEAGVEEESSDEEEGPTFGNADLDAEDSDEDMAHEEDDGLDNDIPGLENTNDIRYADFFAPPAKKQSKTKRMRALPKTQPQARAQVQGDHVEDDVERAKADVRRDLLESDEEESDNDSNSDMDAVRPASKNMSTHEKQRAAIAAEIRRLEAANVAKRDWTLSGEARAADRPLNSLIEEDMEFERVGKPVPVITAEVSEEIEQLIKRRILAREFDEVIRRRPDAASGANEARRGRIDLDDTKPQSGLAEIYEQEHLKATDPGYVDKRSAATKRQHEEISRLWKEVSSQLDLLSNLHFKPKRVEAEIKAVEDKPTISMEDARPVGTGVNAGESMLAPQEVYRPGEEKSSGDVVVRKGGASMSKEEMSREEKLRRRRREKERSKKAGNALPGASAAANGDSKKSKGKSQKQEKSDILSDLRKGNVKVIGKKGDLEDLGGKKGKKAANAAVAAGGAYKL
ncbi:U3 snoRNP protein [Cladophialophora chaetospira]|uniref:U3 snoRNP protein n=1 Tax=Cladophialophora chaetospira TaxID=386627 RepID=A0AA38X6Z5_9EURO|nr:U3 snoRNP protein [Cladophialophora chaetospira]